MSSAVKRAIVGIIALVMIATILRYQLYQRDYVLWLGDRLRHDTCAITWSDTGRLCWPKLALALANAGVMKAQQDAYLPWHIDFAFPRITADGLARPCTNHRIIHVGDAGTTFGLDDGHVYVIEPPQFSDPSGFAKQNNLRPGVDVQVCYYKQRNGLGNHIFTKLKAAKAEVFASGLR